jgi:hypothetical protein
VRQLGVAPLLGPVKEHRRAHGAVWAEMRRLAFPFNHKNIHSVLFLNHRKRDTSIFITCNLNYCDMCVTSLNTCSMVLMNRDRISVKRQKP